MEAATYSYALDTMGRRVGVDAPPGAQYWCIGCGNAMLARTRDFDGRQRAKHFAHRGQVVDCTRDSILHADTQRFIVESFNAAVANGLPYWAEANCQSCKRTLRRENISTPSSVAKPERSVVPGTRSDVVILKGGSPRMIVEVVNSHGLEAATEQAYKDSGIDVILLRVRGLQEPPCEIKERIVVPKQDWIPQPYCKVCRRADANRFGDSRAPAAPPPRLSGEKAPHCVNCGQDMRHARPESCSLHSHWPSDKGATRCVNCGHDDTWHTNHGGGCGLCIAHHGQTLGERFPRACLGA